MRPVLPVAFTDTGAIVTFAVACMLGILLSLMVSFRSLRLKTEGGPQYTGLWRWVGEKIKTRTRAVGIAAGLSLGLLLGLVLDLVLG